MSSALRLRSVTEKLSNRCSVTEITRSQSGVEGTFVLQSVLCGQKYSKLNQNHSKKAFCENCCCLFDFSRSDSIGTLSDSRRVTAFFLSFTSALRCFDYARWPNKYKKRPAFADLSYFVFLVSYSLTGITSMAFLSLLRVSSLPRISVMSNMCGPLDSPTSASLRGFITAPMP